MGRIPDKTEFFQSLVAMIRGFGKARRRGLLLLAGALLWPLSAAAELDAVVVLDSSGSMKKTDPLQLRIPAAKLFISLLGSDDRVGVISFSGQGFPVLGLTSARGEQEQRALFAAVDKVSSKGAYTNLHDALRQALLMLEKQGDAGKPRYILLLSDGKMDVGDPVLDANLLAQIDSDLVPALKTAGIKVYSIAFTEASDIALMQRVSKETKGLFQLAQLDKDLHGVFTTMFESSAKPDMLPIAGGEFLADANIQEVNIVASKASDKTEIVLESPNGERYSAKNQIEGMRWFATPAFDMITVPNPVAGKWKLLSSEGDNKAYVVTDLKLVTNVDDRNLPVNTDVVVEASLSRAGETVTLLEMLANTEFLLDIEHPDGSHTQHSLLDQGAAGDQSAGDGIFSAQVSFAAEGAQKLRLIAKSETFQREITRYFNVTPAVEADPPPATAPAPQPAPEEEPAAEEPPAEAPPAEAEPEEAAAAEETPPAPEKNGVNVGLIIGVFVGINILAGVIIFLVIFLKRRKAKAAAAAAVDEDEEEADSKPRKKG